MVGKRAKAANDTLEKAASVLQAEVDRAICHLRGALGIMAQSQNLHPSLMGVLTLIDRVEFHVIYDPGDSAFELNEEAGIVAFRSAGLEAVLDGARVIADEVGLTDEEEVAHQTQLAINLFVAHELLHICQNFPHFPTVADIKKGAPGLGLPLLDAVADIVAASICAHAEHMAQNLEGGDNGFLRRFSNTLIISYAIGSLIFNARTAPEKRQRALGLLVSAIMIQALAEGRLCRENINPAWKPTSPLLLLNIEASGAFNAFVVDEIAGVLFNHYTQASKPIALELWNSVGTRPIHRTIVLVATLLTQIWVMKPAADTVES
jgi:hypothetical protein